MRLLLFTFLIIIISSLFSSGLRAQEESYGEEELTEDPAYVASPASEKLAKIAARLQLTEAQLPQVEAILLEFAASPPPTTPEAKKARRQALRARVGQLLTPEQRALLQPGRNTTAGRSRKGGSGKRNLLDVLIEDVATPLLDQRRKGRNRPNE